jgi:hypothetical protein
MDYVLGMTETNRADDLGKDVSNNCLGQVLTGFAD